MTAPQSSALAARDAAPAAGVGPHLTPHHVTVLVAIRDAALVCHPAWSHHVPGWGWAGGGDVTLPLQAALNDLHTLRLLAIDKTRLDHVDGDPVTLTGAGQVALDRLGAS